MITFLSGGTGTPKLLQGFRELVSDNDLHVICNTADDYEYKGLYISPDFDTVLYLFAEMLDTDKFWGVKDETFVTLQTLEMLGEPSWFQLGDKDLALHLIRSDLLKQGYDLSAVAKVLQTKLEIQASLYPMSNQRVTSMIKSENKEYHFQEFWVQYRGQLPIEDVTFVGSDEAKAVPEAIKAIDQADRVVIGPSNPVTSIGPILATRGYLEALKRNSHKIWIFSPIVGDAPISGPAAQLMRNQGIEVSSLGVAKHYAQFRGATFVLDQVDSKYKTAIEDLGFHVKIANTIMTDLEVKKSLADLVLSSL